MDLYREEVLEHYDHPRNIGELSGPGVITFHGVNASCGDSVEFYIRVIKVPNTRSSQGSELKISEVKWKGGGCAIMTASASKLSEYLKGKSLEDIRKLGERELVEIAVGFSVNQGRIKCLTLPARVVKQILES